MYVYIYMCLCVCVCVCVWVAWGGVVVKALRYSDGPGIDSRWCHWIFHWHSFRPYHGPGIDSAPSENEYQQHFVGVKAEGTWGWRTHHSHVPNAMKSGNLNFLEPSGTHGACYGTALPLYIYLLFIYGQIAKFILLRKLGIMLSKNFTTHHQKFYWWRLNWK